MQQQVVSLTGASLFVEAGPGLRRRVAAALSVPEEFLRLTHNARELRGDGDEALDASVPVRARLRLEGGKGGFGAMLRQSGKANVKTTNFDACRDLNGRRLRHVNNEAAITKWEAEAEERKLKKQQEAARNAKPSGPPAIARFDDDEYDSMLEGARNRVSDAIAAGLAVDAGGSSSSSSSPPAGEGSAAGAAAPPDSSTAAGKRKAPASEPAAEPAAQKPKMWADPLACLGEGSGEESSSDEA